MMNGCVELIIPGCRGAKGPGHRVFILSWFNEDFDVVLCATFAVGNDGPSIISGCVARSREVGKKKDSQQP